MWKILINQFKHKMKKRGKLIMQIVITYNMNIVTLHLLIYLLEEVSQGGLLVCLIGFCGEWWSKRCESGSSLLS